MAEQNLIQIVVVYGTPLVVPLIAWFLDQRGVARRTKEFDTLLKRTELVEKLQALKKENGTKNADIDITLEDELCDILSDLDSLREIERPPHIKPIEERTWFRQALLLYKQSSIKGALYKSFFYIFSFLGIFGSFSAVFLAPELTAQRPSDFIAILIGMAFYLGIGLLFRAAAIRDYKRRLDKIRINT